jgi:hypothetical protein
MCRSRTCGGGRRSAFFVFSEVQPGRGDGGSTCPQALVHGVRRSRRQAAPRRRGVRGRAGSEV